MRSEEIGGKGAKFQNHKLQVPNKFQISIFKTKSTLGCFVSFFGFGAYLELVILNLVIVDVSKMGSEKTK